MKPKCVPDLNSKLFEEIAILPEKRQEQIKTNVTICNTTAKHLNYQTIQLHQRFWQENDLSNRKHHTKKIIRFKTSMVRSDLCG